jgi:thioredoxin-dependent peroxiredoxin
MPVTLTYPNRVPECELKFYEDSAPLAKSTADLFANKKVILFGVPGAFTPVCSNQLPAFEAKADEIKGLGVDEIYCIGMNDCHVMNAWAASLGVTKVTMLPDGNGEFTNGIGMIIPKFEQGQAIRTWRYVAFVDNQQIKWMYEEAGRDPQGCSGDPYLDTTPEAVIGYLTR